MQIEVLRWLLDDILRIAEFLLRGKIVQRGAIIYTHTAALILKVWVGHEM